MLSKIREHVTGWLGIALLGLIALPFALSGVYSYVGGGTISIVAEVGDREISQREYTQAYQRYRQQVRQALGANFRPELIDEPLLRREALNRLVEKVALLESATDDGYRVSEGRLAREITGIGAFQTNGVFDRELYQERLALQGQSPEGYERDLRSSLLIRQLADGIRATAFVTDTELERALQLDEQVRSIGYTQVGADQVAMPATPAEETLLAWYASNGARFVEPEQVRLDYLELSIDALARGIELSEQELKQLYDDQGAQLQEAKEVRVSHILFAFDLDADAAARTEALEQARSLRQRILGGEEFAAVAKAHSQDPGSADAGGDLGFIGRGMMDPGFESAAFALVPGEVSEPVLTPFGYHLIEVADTRGGVQKSFADVRDEMLELGRRQRAENLFYEQAEGLSNLVFEQPDSLEPAAAILDLEITRSPWIGERGSDWELADPRVIAIAFSNEVLAGGNNSEVIELTEDHLVVVRVAEHRAARQPELGEVRAAVLAAYLNDRVREASVARGEELLVRLQQGTRLEALSVTDGLAMVVVEDLHRNDATLPSAILQTAFRMVRPQAGSVSVAGITLGDGYALIELREVRDGDADIDTGLRPRLANLNADGELRGVISGIKSRVGTRILEENL